MKYIIVVAIIICILFLCVVPRENFTIAERDGVLCNPKTINEENSILPNTVVFVIQGYNYKESPSIYRNGKKVVPMQYFRDSSSNAYFLTIYAPEGLCGSEWILETSDFVEPIVNEGRSGSKLNVTLVRRRDDYNRWGLSC